VGTDGGAAAPNPVPSKDGLPAGGWQRMFIQAVWLDRKALAPDDEEFRTIGKLVQRLRKNYELEAVLACHTAMLKDARYRTKPVPVRDIAERMPMFYPQWQLLRGLSLEGGHATRHDAGTGGTIGVQPRAERFST
jgi:hypothetical protein